MDETVLADWIVRAHIALQDEGIGPQGPTVGYDDADVLAWAWSICGTEKSAGDYGVRWDGEDGEADAPAAK